MRQGRWRRHARAARVVWFGLVTSVLVAMTVAAQVPATGQEELPGDGLMIVVDSSGSMNADAGNGEPRIDAAKAAVSALVADLPESVNVGLMVYGHRVPGTDDQQEAGCQDIETLVDVNPLDRDALTSALGTFEASGFTPIGTSLQQAADGLEVVSGRQTIVLVSDGIDTCAPPPACDVAASLVEEGRPLTVETVGFQVDETARAELECIAAATGGSYRNAPDAASLAEGIQALSSRSFRAYLPVGNAISGGTSLDAATSMELGNHVDALSPGETDWYAFEIPAAQDFFLTSTLIGRPGQPLDEPRALEMAVYAMPVDDDEPTPCGQWVTQVPTGTQPVSAAVGGGVTREDGCTTGPFVATVGLTGPDDDVEFPVELGLFLVPPNTELVPPGRDTQPVSSADSPVGGASHTLAPLVEPGTYADAIRAGERQFWAVTLERGAVLDATLTLPGVEVPETLTTDVTLQLENGARQSDPEGAADAIQQASFSTLEGGEVALTSAPIGADPDGREWLRLPGVYYVTVTVDNAGAPAALFDYELTLEVSGAADDEPTATPTSTSTPSPTPSATAAEPTATTTPTSTGTPSSAPEDGDGGGGMPVWAWILLGVAVVALIGGGIAYAMNRDR
ncbi:MAG TPA: VWA domain-containing protein [Nitriliruptoraceae bacterium]|nr:VWA domain-containing protein [Nitriliruptoraceae bacterium]